jgi:hypothetical protein
MRYTKQDVLQKAAQIRAKYRAGVLTFSDIAFYESLSNWHWGYRHLTPVEKVLRERQVWSDCVEALDRLSVDRVKPKTN